MNFFRRNCIDPTPLLSSRLFDDQSFYTSFLRDLKGCRKEVLLESPFITMRRMYDLYPVLRKLARRGVRITINTRDPREHEYTMQFEAEAVIAELQDMGVRVLYTDKHHRKLAIIDGRILWEGSLNTMSQNTSCEVMRRIESAEMAEQMIEFIKVKKYLTKITFDGSIPRALTSFLSDSVDGSDSARSIFAYWVQTSFLS
jgi:phosphatidylserine/phosphatidylglycerophosphate/cardiolipin synthase-like enzyme